MKILSFTDLHLSDYNPSSRKDNYRESLFNKLEQIRSVVKSQKVDVVVESGDLFHIKAPTKNSHSLVRSTIEMFKSFGCPVVGIAGNHDLMYNSLDLAWKQPLSVVEAAGAIFLCDAWRDKEFRIEKDGVSLKITGFPYIEDFKAEECARIKRTGEDWILNLLHIFASENPGDFFGSRVYGYTEFFDYEPDIQVFGHWHRQQGVKAYDVKGKNKCFVNLGSLSRGSLHYEEVTKTPKIALIDLTKTTIKAMTVSLKCIPAEDCFIMKEREVVKQRTEETEKFVGKLEEELHEVCAMDIEETIEKLDIEREVKEMARHYLEEVRENAV